MAKVTINKDLLRLIVKLKNAGVTDKKMAEHLTQLDEAKKIAKDTRKKVRSSSELPPVSGTSDLPPSATEQQELIKRIEEQQQRKEEELKRKAEEQLKLEKANEWKPLLDYLTMQYWRVKDVVTILAGCTGTGMPPTYVTSLRTGRLLKGSDKTKAQNEFNIIRKHWDGYDHPATAIHPRDVQGFKFNINKDPRVEVTYVISWARKSSIAVPWFDWAMDNKLLSSPDEEEQEREPEYRYDYKPMSSDWGYFPYLELILDEHCGEDKACVARPKAADVYDKLMDKEPKDVEFDKEKRLRYRKQDGEWSDWTTGAVLAQAIRNRLPKRKTTS